MALYITFRNAALPSRMGSDTSRISCVPVSFANSQSLRNFEKMRPLAQRDSTSAAYPMSPITQYSRNPTAVTPPTRSAIAFSCGASPPAPSIPVSEAPRLAPPPAGGHAPPTPRRGPALPSSAI